MHVVVAVGDQWKFVSARPKMSTPLLVMTMIISSHSLLLGLIPFTFWKKILSSQSLRVAGVVYVSFLVGVLARKGCLPCQGGMDTFWVSVFLLLRLVISDLSSGIRLVLGLLFLEDPSYFTLSSLSPSTPFFLPVPLEFFCKIFFKLGLHYHGLSLRVFHYDFVHYFRVFPVLFFRLLHDGHHSVDGIHGQGHAFTRSWHFLPSHSTFSSIRVFILFSIFEFLFHFME